MQLPGLMGTNPWQLSKTKAEPEARTAGVVMVSKTNTQTSLKFNLLTMTACLAKFILPCGEVSWTVNCNVIYETNKLWDLIVQTV